MVPFATSGAPGLGAGAGAIAVGYLLGSVPSADVAARLSGDRRVDLRRDGSGNPGGLNTVLVLGRGWGVAVIAADVAKGVLAGEVGRALAGPTGASLGAAAAVIGHCFPVWNGGRGGKGVATSAGQVLTTFPVFAGADAAVAAGVVRAWPYSHRTVASMVVSTSVWLGASVLWWRRRWPTGRGPATGALPLGAAIGGSVVVGRMLTGLRRRPGAPVGRAGS